MGDYRQRLTDREVDSEFPVAHDQFEACRGAGRGQRDRRGARAALPSGHRGRTRRCRSRDDDIAPTVALPVVEQGTLVEIKSAMVRLDSGGTGRFYLRREQHEQVRADAGVYLFAVCEPTPDRAILALKIVAARS